MWWARSPRRGALHSVTEATLHAVAARLRSENSVLLDCDRVGTSKRDFTGVAFNDSRAHFVRARCDRLDRAAKQWAAAIRRVEHAAS